MPVKMTEGGKPLEATLKQPAAPLPPPAPPGGATDALLQTEVAQQDVIAHAETGTLAKNGLVENVSVEQIKTGFTVPAGYAGPVGKVTYGCAATVSTGNYENVRPFVQIEVPFIPGSQDAVYDYAYDWADARISALISNIKQASSGA